ncbi:MAG: M13 family metallopeptidase [Ferruginibacter sp.]
MKKWFIAAGIGLCIVGCQTKSKEIKADILAANYDSTVSPGEDIFLYANGGWIKKNPIPDEESSWSIGNLVVEENTKRLRLLSEDAAKENAAVGTTSRKIGDFWKTAMDTVKIEKDGVAPLQTYFDKINAVKDINSLIITFAELGKIGVSSPISFSIYQDAKNSDQQALYLWQAGLGLPEREYYLKNDSSTIKIRAAYLKNIAQILVLSGTDTATAGSSAKAIFATETSIAKVHRKLEDLRDPYANYNKMAVSDLSKLSVLTNWKQFLDIYGITMVDSVIVGQPEYVKAIDNILKSNSLDVWKVMLRYRLVKTFSEQLPDKFGKENFELNKLFSGAKERKPRWKRVIRAEENAMGELLGQLYVKEFFNEKAKKRYEDMVEAVKAAYKKRIEQLTWMSDSTKAKALIKLAAVKKKVGYPEKWKDFSKMNISTESYVQNVIEGNIWWHNYEIAKLGKPVNRDEWDMTPQTYNAYYNPSNNEIVLPAGIFTVPGYRDEELDDATVYGYAGASTIGHEITHGFDDEGRQFDEKGNLKSWWTKTDEAEFTKRAQVMIDQFNNIEPLPGTKINGKATLGENIADLGGILLALDAFRETEQFKKNEKLAGFTPLQRYFLGYSLGWLGYEREEALKNQLMVDVHSPAKYRVNGPFVNVPEFYTAFNIKPTDKMFRADSLRVKIW